MYVSGGEVLYSGCMYLGVRFYTVGVCIWRCSFIQWVYVSGGEVLYSGCMYLGVRFYTVGVCIWR